MSRPEQPDGVLLLDKPAGYSSTQALSRCKRALAARKAGHTGTLDPFATGLLPLAFGEATKFSRFLIDAVKAYSATLRLGVVSSTGDVEGDLGPECEVDADDGRIAEVLRSFVGVRQQIPPMHSAVRVGGQRLYDLARQGIEIARPARTIEILALAAAPRNGNILVISVTCTKGTYVRTLAADIGAALGCGAYLTALRRTAVGPLRIEDAVTLEALQALGTEGARRLLRPVTLLVEGLPRCNPDPDSARRFTQGQVIGLSGAEAGTDYALFGPGGALLGVGRCEQDGRVAPARLMATGGEGEIP